MESWERARQGLSGVIRDIRDTLPSRDAHIKLELCIEEDVDQELADYSQLARNGQFTDACNLFSKVLKPHAHCFPVLAEEVDCLLQQGNSKSLQSLLERGDKAMGPWLGRYGRLKRPLLEILSGYSYQRDDGVNEFLCLAWKICAIHLDGLLQGDLEAFRMCQREIPRLRTSNTIDVCISCASTSIFMILTNM